MLEDDSRKLGFYGVQSGMEVRPMDCMLPVAVVVVDVSTVV